MYHFLNIIFHLLHLTVITINVVFVFIPSLRKIHFIVINVTALSWLLGGLWGNFGYCFLTDYHWSIKENLGEISLAQDYMSYLLVNFLDISLSRNTVQSLIAWVFIVTFTLSWFFFLKKTKTSK